MHSLCMAIGVSAKLVQWPANDLEGISINTWTGECPDLCLEALCIYWNMPSMLPVYNCVIAFISFLLRASRKSLDKHLGPAQIFPQVYARSQACAQLYSQISRFPEIFCIFENISWFFLVSFVFRIFFFTSPFITT